MFFFCFIDFHFLLLLGITNTVLNCMWRWGNSHVSAECPGPAHTWWTTVKSVYPSAFIQLFLKCNVKILWFHFANFLSNVKMCSWVCQNTVTSLVDVVTAGPTSPHPPVMVAAVRGGTHIKSWAKDGSKTLLLNLSIKLFLKIQLN